nr:PDF receptor-like [Procambarus clarkii]
MPPEGLKCLEDFWNSLPLDGVYCNATWDTLYCWPATQAGKTAKESCATVFSEVPDLFNYPEAFAYRECDGTGTWLWNGWTNYSQCLSVIDHQDWLCKTLLALGMYAQMASINWMFVEGLFLHSRLTSNVFDSGAPFTLYYTIGWGWSLVFLVAWATAMAIHHPVHCWRGYAVLPYVWILVAPMVTALMINLLFLVNIIRILVTKLRASDAVETTQVRKAIKATAVLFPLLGITNLLFAVNPGKGDLEGAYMLTNALLQSSQGVFVSVLYCFLNGEVQELLRKRWRQYRMRQLGYPATHRRKSTKSTIILETSLSLRPSPQPTPQHSRVQAHTNHALETSVV